MRLLASLLPTACVVLAAASTTQDPPGGVRDEGVPGPGAPAGELQDPILPTGAPQDVDAATVTSGPLPEDEATTEEEVVPPYAGRFVTGYGEALAHLDAGDLESARQVAGRLLVPTADEPWLAATRPRFAPRLARAYDDVLARFGFETRTSRQRAYAHHLLAVTERTAGEFEAAEAHLAKARALAGPGALRQDAVYDQGWLDLTVAEEHYDEIPEVHGASNNAMNPGFVPNDDQQVDHLAAAKAAYLDARAHFVERLGLDWRDADTRANVELIARRLKSIADIEEERRQDEGQERSDEGESDQEQNPEAQDNQDAGSGQPGGDQDQDQEPQESEQQQDQEGEQQDADDAEAQEESEEQGDDGQQESASEEKHITEEEMKRMLENLREHGERGEEVMQGVRRHRRQQVEKDW